MSEDQDTNLYTTAEAAEMLGMTEGGIREMVKRNRLKPTIRGTRCSRIVRSHRFDLATIETYRKTKSRFSPKECPHCHKQLPTPHSNNQKYCSPFCHNEAVRRRRRDVPEDYIAPAATYFLRVPATCEHCGAEYLSLAHQKYCSNKCRVNAFNKRARLARAREG